MAMVCFEEVHEEMHFVYSVYSNSKWLHVIHVSFRLPQVEMRGRMDPVRSLVWNSRSRCLMAAVGSSVVVFRAPNR